MSLKPPRNVHKPPGQPRSRWARALEDHDQALADRANEASDRAKEEAAAMKAAREPEPIEIAPVELSFTATLIDRGIDPDEMREFCRHSIRYPDALPCDSLKQMRAIRECFETTVEEMLERGAPLHDVKQCLEGLAYDLSVDIHEARAEARARNNGSSESQQPRVDRRQEEAQEEAQAESLPTADRGAARQS